VTFDPFGDFATEGYLRNFEKEKDLAIVKRAENASFMTGLDEAFAILAKVKTFSYDDVLTTHGILFGAIYPWAGQDRTQTAPKLTIRKGSVIFANAPEIRAAVQFALLKGQDKASMKAKPGEIMVILPMGIRFSTATGAPS
jgi:cell filamentation protein, protein adenylyltransferase